MLPRILSYFARDAYAITHYSGVPDGSDYENAISELAHLLGFHMRQGPGSLSLFGMRSASGCRHEIDLGISDPGVVALAEVKSHAGGIGKNDVMIFAQKTFDYYLWRLRQGMTDPIWRFFISATPLPNPVHIYCIQQSIILIEPSYIPLPVLLRFAQKPEAEQVFDDSRIAEAVRLFEPACLPLQQVFVPDGESLKIGIKRYFGSDADDARWLAHEMTSDLLAFLDQTGKGPFRERARVLAKSGMRALSRVAEGYSTEEESEYFRRSD